MVWSKGIACAKLLRNAQSISNNLAKQSIRHSSGDPVYREPAKVRPQNIVIANVLGATMWYWIMYHFLSEPGHIFGEFDYPDPAKWTDEELGIPPDDA